jgi:hypothetical protein
MKKKIVPWDLVSFGKEYANGAVFVYEGVGDNSLTIFRKVDGSGVLHGADLNDAERVGVSLVGLDAMQFELLSCLSSIEPKTSMEKDILDNVTKRVKKVFG